METKPKLKLTLTPFDKKLEQTSTVLLAIIWIMSTFSFYKLPTTIVIHFNAQGKPDGYGDKSTLLILPFIATFLFIGLTKLNKYPHLFNYLNTITLSNAYDQYSLATRNIRWLKIILLLIFLLMIVFTYLTTAGLVSDLGGWFLPVICCLIISTTILSIIITSKKRKV